MRAYIDESGDLGTDGRGTRWFTFGAVCIADHDISTMRDSYFALLRKTKGRKIVHFADWLHEERVLALNHWWGQPWVGIVASSDTTAIPKGQPTGLDDSLHHARYVLKYALERVSKHAESRGERCSVTVENGPVKPRELRDYLNALHYKDIHSRIWPNSLMRWDWIDWQNIEFRDKADEPMLGMADALSHSLQRALEPHKRSGTTEAAYACKVARNLWRGTSPDYEQILWNGWVLMPTPMLGQFRQEFWIVDALDRL